MGASYTKLSLNSSPTLQTILLKTSRCQSAKTFYGMQKERYMQLYHTEKDNLIITKASVLSLRENPWPNCGENHMKQKVDNFRYQEEQSYFQ